MPGGWLPCKDVAMADLLLHIVDSDYQRLQKAAQRAGKSIGDLVHELIATHPLKEDPFDVTNDPLYLFEGFEVKAPPSLASQVDRYLYKR